MTIAPPPYPAGLRLAGRRVVVVGGGNVAQRRIPTLLAAGADVVVVSPEVTPAVEGMAEDRGTRELTWVRRGFMPADLDEAWYVIAATDRAEVNHEVSVAAEERRVFCVRSDEGEAATAWTPATGRHDGVTVAVLANREPRRSAALRDDILAGLCDGRLSATHAHDRTPEVVLVGGGPGDPDLATAAARHALASADVVVADRLAPRELLDELPAHVELVDVAKLPRGRSAVQEEINRLLVERVAAGQRVVRFKGGDPFVFGRGFEEVIACREAGVPVSVVPGVTSAIAVPARAGIPVTHRGIAHEVSLVSGHLPPGHPESLVNWRALGAQCGTLVLLMAVDNAPAIARALVEAGRAPDTPVAVVQEGTMPGERVVWSRLATLAEDLADAGVRPPAVIVVGDVVAVAAPDRYADRLALRAARRRVRVVGGDDGARG